MKILIHLTSIALAARISTTNALGHDRFHLKRSGTLSQARAYGVRTAFVSHLDTPCTDDIKTVFVTVTVAPCTAILSSDITISRTKTVYDDTSDSTSLLTTSSNNNKQTTSAHSASSSTATKRSQTTGSSVISRSSTALTPQSSQKSDSSQSSTVHLTIQTDSTLTTRHSAASSSTSITQTSPNTQGKCSKDSYNPQAFTEGFPNYFGFNMVNTAPYDTSLSTTSQFRTSDQWLQGMKNLKAHFPTINAIRMYSTTDGNTKHLLNAMPHAKPQSLKILVGIWAVEEARFKIELQALDDVISKYGCDDILAISVGNEDLMAWSALAAKPYSQTTLVQDLVNRIGRTRKMLRDKGCCNTPVTHTDIVGELIDPAAKPLISAVDHAIIANIFPFWSGVGADAALETMKGTAAKIVDIAQTQLHKAVWLGETGWPTIDTGHHNPQMKTDTLLPSAARYFAEVGCQILNGDGTAFYYVDWDEDMHSNAERPVFGVFDWQGKPKYDLTCPEGVKFESSGSTLMPAWLGGSGG